MRKLVFLAFGALAFVPAAARAQGGMEKDPTKSVAGGGVKVSGWQARLDPRDASMGMKLDQLKFEDMGGGFHITAGPHAIYWNPANVAKGNYTVGATMTKTAPTSHPESYGIFIGGANLDADNQSYLYCVVFGDGTFSVIHRAGAETHTIVGHQANDAVQKANDKGGAKDDIAMTVSADKVACSINDKEVWSAPKTGMLANTDGIYGLRASHNLSIHVSNFKKR
jgi:hypothetical protein